MRFLYAAFLLLAILLSALSPTVASPVKHPKPHNKDSPKLSCQSPKYNHIFFVAHRHPENTTQVVYLMTTPWVLHYPSQLRKAIDQHGYDILTESNFTSGPGLLASQPGSPPGAPTDPKGKFPFHCTWQQLFSLTEAQALKRGSGFVNYGFLDQPLVEWGQLQASEVGWMMEVILGEQFPWVEIAVLLSCTVGPLLLAAIWFLWREYILINELLRSIQEDNEEGERRRRRRKGKAGEETEGEKKEKKRKKNGATKSGKRGKMERNGKLKWWNRQWAALRQRWL
ncbi:hypothetical protein K402DRAFT_177081 [Aulographum hederae CBS 113979]|uniref:Uncharacterized protein n=1 Tax=Aulographum hederae CBS 113979 TaxID=1176131 RepID=A0A6G1GQU6_9PEZI|nr:hypothetical protein K402DRAFT_177081 [Aulographum hederae CBS 113979]